MKEKIRLLMCAAILLPLLAGAQTIAPAEVYGSQIDPTRSDPPTAATPYEGEKKSIFSSRDNRERVVNAPEKPAQIKKLKFGTDQTESTGAFKGSLLDKQPDLGAFVRKAEAEKQKELAEPRSDAAASPAPSQPQKADSPTPSPTESPSPRPSASVQDRQSPR